MPIINLTRKTTLASTLEFADTPLKRMQGLLGRDHLKEGHALVITGCNSIHMFFMKFAIDVIFIDKNDCIVGLVKNIKPFSISPVFFKSSCAIELRTGTIDSSCTQEGDQLSVSSIN